MDIHAILKQLKAERDMIDECIGIVQQMAAVSGKKRRGRPPKWLQELEARDTDLGQHRRKRE